MITPSRGEGVVGNKDNKIHSTHGQDTLNDNEE